MAGEDFRNLFAVADDDQIIYQWNGASFRNIESFLSTFSAELIQLPTNYRCPPAIVEAANKLVAYNVQRTSTKQPLIAGKTKLKLPAEEHIQLREFASEEDEADGIALEIAQKGKAQWGQTTVLARNRALLDRMRSALQKHQIPAVIAQRRDDFLSAHLRWLVACLIQTVRPLDRRNFLVLVEAFNRIADIELSSDQLTVEAEATGRGYLATWLAAANATSASMTQASELQHIGVMIADPTSAKTVVDRLLAEFQSVAASGEEAMSDLAEDLAAWREISSDIGRHLGRNAPLEQFLQELQLRSKEPSPKPDSVTLMTVHGAKGREFDGVYVIGMAEDILPSYQSRQKGDKSPEMEEERRNCFVAITRAKECLILSRADRYRGWEKQASRFLVEMELVI
jgi:DNA helicase-2/ATP-dependent DNA helicase PcrA